MLKTMEMAMAVNLQPVGYFISSNPSSLRTPSIMNTRQRGGVTAILLIAHNVVGDGGRHA